MTGKLTEGRHSAKAATFADMEMWLHLLDQLADLISQILDTINGFVGGGSE